MVEHVSRAEKRSENVHLHSLNMKSACRCLLKMMPRSQMQLFPLDESGSLGRMGKLMRKKRQIQIQKITLEVLSASYDTQLLTLLLFAKGWQEIQRNLNYPL